MKRVNPVIPEFNPVMLSAAFKIADKQDFKSGIESISGRCFQIL